jgi:alpha-L-rhamnosidase
MCALPGRHESIPDARIVLETVRGRIEAGWQQRGGAVVADVRVPVNSVAEVILPNGARHELGSGRHRT